MKLRTALVVMSALTLFASPLYADDVYPGTMCVPNNASNTNIWYSIQGFAVNSTSAADFSSLMKFYCPVVRKSSTCNTNVFKIYTWTPPENVPSSDGYYAFYSCGVRRRGMNTTSYVWSSYENVSAVSILGYNYWEFNNPSPSTTFTDPVYTLYCHAGSYGAASTQVLHITGYKSSDC
jgi:hypothetical protein